MMQELVFTIRDCGLPTYQETEIIARLEAAAELAALVVGGATEPFPVNPTEEQA